jgi:hypothetical protein
MDYFKALNDINKIAVQIAELVVKKDQLILSSNLIPFDTYEKLIKFYESKIQSLMSDFIDILHQLTND